MRLSAQSWIEKTFKEAIHVEDETFQVIADFALIWNIFEGTECETGASIKQLENFARRIAGKISKDKIDELLSYWRDRYTENEKTNYRFDHLNFRQDDKKDMVEAVLLSKGLSSVEEIHALLIIILRLRNNLFHGIKVISNINEQQENLGHAVFVLQQLMPLSGRYMYLGVV